MKKKTNSSISHEVNAFRRLMKAHKVVRFCMWNPEFFEWNWE